MYYIYIYMCVCTCIHLYNILWLYPNLDYYGLIYSEILQTQNDLLEFISPLIVGIIPSLIDKINTNPTKAN